jgi:prevent-host-death family protein
MPKVMVRSESRLVGCGGFDDTEGVEVSVSQARVSLSRLLRRAQAGEVVIITRRGKPVAQLVGPHDKNKAQAKNNKKPRPLGMDNGRIFIADDFDAPLPASLAAAFGVRRKRRASPRPAKP